MSWKDLPRDPRCAEYCLHEFGPDSCDAYGAPCVELREQQQRSLAVVAADTMDDATRQSADQTELKDEDTHG